MPRTTPPRPVDVEALFPELRPWRSEALRLHPRPGAPAIHESSVGGPLLWPADELWPTCGDEHGTEEPPVLVPVLQLHRDDAPGVDFPPGSDLLQVLWCPFDHPDFYCPLPRVYWRIVASMSEVRSTPPAPAEARDDHLPAPCVLDPEAVADYPSWDLPAALQDRLSERFEQLEQDAGWIYQHHLAAAPGIKVGGYPSWTQEPQWPECEGCGQAMEHLLTVSSAEYDGESRRTWLPDEDRGEARQETQRPHGLMLGDMGGVYVFECRTCPARPFTHRFDCS